MKKKINSLLLRTVGKVLPLSYSRPFGVFAKRFRYYCAKNIVQSIGKDVNIEKGAILTSDTIIGNNSGVGVDCMLTKGVVIGDGVMMGPECLFYTKNHKFDKEMMKYDGYTETKEIIVEDDVWFGSRCIILPGVTIGKGATVGAGSIVTKDVPAYYVVAGNPAKPVKNLLGS